MCGAAALQIHEPLKLKASTITVFKDIKVKVCVVISCDILFWFDGVHVERS